MSFIKKIPGYVAYVRKAIIQILGLAGALLALGLLPSNYAAYVAAGIAVLTTILHYLTPNADDPGGNPPMVDATNVNAADVPADISTLPAGSEGGKHESP